jgi:hypothetical protein
MVKITDPDALEKMGKIEGEYWMKHQNQLTGYSFASFLKEYKTPEWDYLPEQFIEIDGNRAIYGEGGYNRYFVNAYTGEIFISKFHAREEKLKLAEEIGFSIC